jgi:CubicO group peptidase (beta-lactamase class C family)
MFRIVTSFMTVLALFCCLTSRGVEAEGGKRSTIKGVVDGIARPLSEKHHIPGMAIAITLDGRNYFFNYGVESKETGKPVTDRTLFEVGSVSKTFAATLATYAQIKGALSLNDETSKYLPVLRGSGFDRITLLNLATHTSGLPLFVPNNISDTNELEKYLEHWQPPFHAGSHRIYSNIGIGLLGAIAAKSMNESYEEALQNGLFPALGMIHSYVNVPPGQMKDYAQGYTKNDAPVRMNPGALAAEAYGVKSCTADLIRFIEENMGLIKLDARLRNALLETHAGYFKSAGLTQDLVWEEYPYPVEMRRLLEGNDAVLKETVATRLAPPLSPRSDVLINKTGSTNGFSAYVAFIPARKIGIVILANKAYPMNEEVTAAYQILTKTPGAVSGAAHSPKSGRK